MRAAPRPFRSLRPLTLAALAWGCAPSAEMPRDMDMPREPPRPVMQVAGPNLHLIALWDADTLVYGEGADWPGERQPWPALYRAPAAGGPPELLARDAYRVLLRRRHRDADPPPVLVYLTAKEPGQPTLRTPARLFVCRPGQAPEELTLADPPLLLQPALLSPDNRYLLTYGVHPDRSFFSIDLYDLQTRASRRIAHALSTSVPRWLGFDGAGPRYLMLPNLEGLRPYALFPLGEGDGLAGPPMQLPGRVAGVLPDGRVVLEGTDLLVQDLRPGSSADVLARGPVRPYAAFVVGGAAYFLRTVPGQRGPLLRITPGQGEAELLPLASELWFVGTGGGAAYVADRPEEEGRNMRAVLLPQGPSVPLIEDGVRAYRPLPDGGVLVFRMAAPEVTYWAPGRPAATKLSARARAAWPAGADRFAVVEGEGEGRTGALRLLRPGGEPAPGDPAGARAIDGVDLVDVVEPRGLLAYSVPAGAGAGIWVWQLP